MYTLNGSTADFYKKAVAIARHYGFVSLEEASGSQNARTASQQNRAPLPSLAEQKKMDPFGGAFSSTLCRAIEKNILPTKEPILLYDTGSLTSSKVRFSLSLIGARGSIAEAIVLKATQAILDDNGIKRVTVRLNSIGDRDSSAKYVREVNGYLRRNSADLPEDVHAVLKDDPLAALLLLVNARHQIIHDMPRSVEFLTGPSRKHLREVVEFLEIANIPYELDNLVIGHRDSFTQTLFELHHLDGIHDVTEPLARGGRVDEFAKRLTRSVIPSVTINLVLTTSAKDTTRTQAPAPANRKPILYFIHVGFEAKLRSLRVIEVFRKAHIPFYQCLHQDKLTEQLAHAERFSAPYIVIMGHKEALEDQVIVRNASTRAQQTVPVDMLPAFFKHAGKT